MRKDIFPKISTISKAGFLSLNMMYINAMDKKLKNKNVMKKIAMNRKKENKFLKINEEKIKANNFYDQINNRKYSKESDDIYSIFIDYKYGNLIKTDDKDFKSYFRISKDEIDKLKKEIQKRSESAKKLRNSVYELDKNEEGNKLKLVNIASEIDKNNMFLAESIDNYYQEKYITNIVTLVKLVL